MKKIVLGGLLSLALQPMVYAADKTEEKAKTETAAMTLPAAAFVDEKTDMVKSMKKMGRNFKKLRKAKKLEHMKAPAQELAIFASQSQAVAEEMVEGMKKMRMGVAQLQAAIDQGDLDAAKKILKVMNEKRKEAHDYFGVGDD